MIRFDEYRQHDGLGLAALVQRREITATELLECAIARAGEVNPAINAIILPMYTQARRYVMKHTPDGRFAGVPAVLKDLLASFAGVPMSNGSRAWRYCVSAQHSTLVQRLCSSGVVVMGKTNTPELGLLGTTENRAFGATRNPWNLSRTAGGSSGGTAAAVAAGIVPFGSAGDGGGSIRIPASCCGLFGLKPSRGLVPSGPAFAEVWDGAVSEHVITRTVRDSAALLDVLAGPDAAAHTVVTQDKAGYSDALSRDVPKLRIAFSTQSPLGGSVDRQCVHAVRQAAKLLSDLGHEVEEATPANIDPRALIKAYSDIYLAHVRRDVDDVIKLDGFVHAARNFEPATFFIAQLGKRFTAGDAVRSRQYWVDLRHIMARFHERHDVWMTPVMAAPPARLGELRSSRLEEVAMQIAGFSGLHRLLPLDAFYRISGEQMQKVPFTQIANLTGQPAMSVPLAWSDAGLPIGVQFVGRVMEDGLLLQLARQLEQASPWFDRVPAL